MGIIRITQLLFLHLVAQRKHSEFIIITVITVTQKMRIMSFSLLIYSYLKVPSTLVSVPTKADE